MREAISFMWALVDYNARMLSAIITMNVEDPTAAHPSNPRDWSVILVSSCLAALAHSQACFLAGPQALEPPACYALAP